MNKYLEMAERLSCQYWVAPDNCTTRGQYQPCDHCQAAGAIRRLVEENEAYRASDRASRDREQATRRENERLRQEVAELCGYDNAMLRKFDPQAAESTDLSTWISCNLAEIERLRETIASNWGDPNDPKLLSALTGKEE